jgi:murein L,D-transpeptidase YafK
VHLFPARLDHAGYARLTSVADPKLKAFWSQLRDGYLRFEATRRPPRVGVAGDGRYSFADR